MTLDTFFEKFHLFADAPDAVAKMRELVLHLAVHGNLVSQSSDDAPATELLKRSRVEMAKRMAARQAKQEKPAQPVSDDEATFSLPAGWAWCRLVDAGQFINGLAFKPSDWGNVGRPIIRIQNLSGRNPDYNRTTGTYDSSVLVQDGDILVSWSATLDAFVWRGEEGVLNQHIFRVLPAPLADKGFLFWLLKWVIRQLAESKHAHGLVMSHINRGPFLARPIPLPPLAEQKRIVAKVDELMTLCDQLEMQQQERETRHAALARATLARFADAPTPENLNFLFHSSFSIHPSDLRKSILTLAVQGKLVPQDPKDEPAGHFVRLIAKNLGRAQRTLSSETEDNSNDSTKPFLLPPGWAWARFPDLGEFGRGKSKHRPRNAPLLFTGGKHRLVQTGDVARANGTIQTYTSLYNDVGLAQSKMWPAGTLCITIAANIADSGILGFDACFPDSIVGFIPAEPIPSVRYFEYFMRTAKEHLEEFAPSTAQKNINLGILNQVWIPIPPLAEQRRIVAKVDTLMALVDALETQIATARTAATALLEAVVAELTIKE